MYTMRGKSMSKLDLFIYKYMYIYMYVYAVFLSLETSMCVYIIYMYMYAVFPRLQCVFMCCFLSLVASCNMYLCGVQVV